MSHTSSQLLPHLMATGRQVVALKEQAVSDGQGTGCKRTGGSARTEDISQYLLFRCLQRSLLTF